MFTTICRLENSAARSARHQLPGRPPRLPECRVNDFRIVGIEHQVSDAGGVVAVENLSPGLSAISRLVDTAIGARTKYVSLSSNVDNIGVRGMHADPRYLSRIRQANRRPGFPAVRAAPDAVTMRHVAAYRILAGSDVDDVGIGLTDSYSADGTAEVLVGYGCPGDSAIDGLEDTAASGPEIVFVRAFARPGDGNRSPATEGRQIRWCRRGPAAPMFR